MMMHSPRKIFIAELWIGQDWRNRSSIEMGRPEFGVICVVRNYFFAVFSSFLHRDSFAELHISVDCGPIPTAIRVASAVFETRRWKMIDLWVYCDDNTKTY